MTLCRNFAERCPFSRRWPFPRKDRLESSANKLGVRWAEGCTKRLESRPTLPARKDGKTYRLKQPAKTDTGGRPSGMFSAYMGAMPQKVRSTWVLAPPMNDFKSTSIPESMRQISPTSTPSTPPTPTDSSARKNVLQGLHPQTSRLHGDPLPHRLLLPAAPNHHPH